VLRDVPAGSATGVLLQEVKAADDQTLESVDYYTLAKQHDAAGFASLEDEMAAQRIRDVRTGKGRRRHRYALVRLTGTVVQYATGLIVGAFQALVLLFYQWIVDPAADGTW